MGTSILSAVLRAAIGGAGRLGFSLLGKEVRRLILPATIAARAVRTRGEHVVCQMVRFSGQEGNGPYNKTPNATSRRISGIAPFVSVHRSKSSSQRA
jgi:hypothetical protein